MGEFVDLHAEGTSNREQSGYGPQSNDQQTVYLEFIQAKVQQVEYNPIDVSKINSIQALPTSGNYSGLNTLDYVEAIPLLRGIVDQPEEGDVVLLCNFGNIDYYLGPLNTANSPEVNPEPSRTLQNLSANTTVTEDISNAGYRQDVPVTGITHKGKFGNTVLDYPQGQTSENIQSQVGDLIFEGRMGNSIRLGTRATGPYTFISNSSTSVYENFYNNSGIISMTAIGTLNEHIGLIADQTQDEIKFSVDVDDNDKKTRINYGYIEPQIYIGSNRIIFNTTSDNILMSSATTVDINSLQNINLSTPKDVVIDSQDIYLGKEARDNGQPVVLGIELFEILSELLALLSTIGTSAPAPQPVMVLAPAPVNPAPGSTEPPTPTIAGPLGPKVANIQNRLSKILSGNIFVKNNEG